MKTILIMLALFVVIGCDIQKQSGKRKTETYINDTFEQREYRPADNIKYIPPANIILRDTTVVVVSDKGTTMRMVYDSEGKVREAECLPALIELVTKMTKQFEQSEKDKQSEKTEKFSDTWILYIIGGIVVIIMFGFLLMYKTLNKNTQAIAAIMQKIAN